MASIDTACMKCGDYGTFVGEYHCGKNSNKTKEEVVAVVRAHIKRFLKIESLYTRSDTRQEYFKPIVEHFKDVSFIQGMFDAATDTDMSTRPRASALQMNSSQPAIRNANHG